MSEAIKTEEYKGYTIEIIPDDMGESPREWDNLGTMVCFHNRNQLGDKDHGYDHRKHKSWTELKQAIIRKEDPAVIIPIYMYDHSGITIKTTPFSSIWDSGQIGFIFVSKKKARYTYSWTNITKSRKELLTKYLVNEVKTLDQYLTGDVYGFKITKGIEDVDSCWGFYGSEYCLREAKSIVKSIIEREEKDIKDCQLVMAL